jgi:hypothetical protein
MCAGVQIAEDVSWHDLPSELLDIVLARVPLLRLAQMAEMGRDFEAAYRQRLTTYLASTARFNHSSVGPAPGDYSRALCLELGIRNHPLRYLRNRNVPIQRVYGPLKHVRLPQQDISGCIYSWVHNSVRGVRVSRGFPCPSVPVQVTGVFSCEVHESEPYNVSCGAALVTCLVAVGQRHRCSAKS